MRSIISAFTVCFVSSTAFAAPQEKDCNVDFSGTWTGKCEVNPDPLDSSKFIWALKIEQQSCDYITIVPGSKYMSGKMTYFNENAEVREFGKVAISNATRQTDMIDKTDLKSWSRDKNSIVLMGSAITYDLSPKTGETSPVFMRRELMHGHMTLQNGELHLNQETVSNVINNGVNRGYKITVKKCVYTKSSN